MLHLQQYVTGLDSPGIETRWGRIFRTVQTGPGAHPASCTMGTGSFQGVERPGRGVDHPPTPSSAEVKERVELYLYSTSGPWCPVLGWALPLSLRNPITLTISVSGHPCKF